MSTETTTADDDLTARLYFLGSRTDAARINPEAFDLNVLLGDFQSALAAIEAVLRLHVDEVIPGRPSFRVCSRCSGRPKWPCPEVAAISQWMLGRPSHLWLCGCLINDAGAHRVGCPDHPEGVRG